MDATLNDKVPPHNIEAEQAVLGALLLNWSAMAEVVSTLRPDRFYSLSNQVIYEAMVKLYTKSATGDTISLINELTVENKLEQAGGAAYIASLTDTVPSAANIDYYANMVLDRAARRDLIHISSELKASSFDLQKESDSLLDEAEQKIFALAEKNETTQIYSAQNIMVKEIELIEARYKSKNQFTGVPTGFAKLDTYTSGFQDSELIIIGARPSIGKTALALSMIQNIACEKRIPCGFFSLEMPYESIGMRLLAQEARVPMNKIRSGMLKIDDVKKIQDAAGRWFEAPLYTVDTPNMKLLDLRAVARRMVKNQGVKIIFIDYIGLISTDDPTAPVFEQVSLISKSLKALARELSIPIVALCQVARDAEGQEPNLAQLRGSGSIEQDADVVMFLHRDRIKDGDSIAAQDAKIILAKQRNGACGDIPIMFLPSYSKFENKADDA
ncbi:MAG: replicative DNA helicase [Treponema sp.]|nr:replicative DNA helicase [Treponema sp.]MCI6591291.1 replicative DNA helicase [Spirochaetia bacterium]MDD7533184.1 replicative DNA helicase [Treponema sp.]MDY3723272.1 replicative DNA helicase [Treponema sp.]MDY5757428.1 replicative DNA helicase [Treponema sp.]